MENKLALSGRYVDTNLERPRWRFTANYRLWQTLQIGVEFNAAAQEVGALVDLVFAYGKSLASGDFLRQQFGSHRLAKRGAVLLFDWIEASLEKLS